MKTSTVEQVMKYSGKKSLVAVCGLVLMGSALSLTAQSIWDGGGGDGKWSTAANWQGDAVPASASTTVIQFAGASQAVVDVDSAIAAKSIAFNSGASAFTVGGSALTLTGVSTGVANVVNNSASLQTINSALAITTGGISAYAGNMQINGTVTMSGSGFRMMAGVGKTLTVSGAIAGTISGDSVSVDATGGTVVLSNATSSWTGGLNVWNGSLILNGNTVNTWATPSVIGKNGAINVGVSGGTGNAAVLAGGAYTIGNSFRINSNANAVAYTLGGSTADNSTFSGLVRLGSASGAAKGVSVTAADGGRVNFTAGILRESTATGAGDIVTKTGNGVVALSGTSSYSGVTTVSAGTLLVNGTLSAALTTGTVSVGAGATLGGNGYVVRSISVADNAKFSVGDMDLLGNSLVGTFTVGDVSNAASLLFSSSSILNYDLGSIANADKVIVYGDVTLDGVLNLTALSGFDVGTYTLLTYTGSLNNLGLTMGTTPGGYSYSIDTLTMPGEVRLTVAVPEPGSMALVTAAILFFVVWTGRRSLHLKRGF